MLAGGDSQRTMSVDEHQETKPELSHEHGLFCFPIYDGELISPGFGVHSLC